MNRIGQLIARAWKPALILVWLLVLASLFPNHYTTFLRPAFGWVLVIAVIILSGMFGTSIERPNAHRFGRGEMLRALILVLPLAYLLNVRGTSLDAYAFQNRSVGLPSLPTANHTSPTGLSLFPVDPTGESRTTCREVTLLDLYRAPSDHVGQPVRLIGMYYRDDSAIEDLGPDTCVIFRFTINCCAADGTPLSVLAKAEKHPHLASGTWVEAEGIFTIREEEGRRIPMLLNADLRQTSSPEHPYLL